MKRVDPYNFVKSLPLTYSYDFGAALYILVPQVAPGKV
jgi:hypothetical protein